ncbi:hypothetical protein L917_13092 [Phytophthora nicotianae]|uniref:Uncharacterized protein n=2 Tax=Phytophthora nicotianae TaxID=4792 RepID=W2KRD4_PHYNI|nr:hypothetical protein L917_13092 [Phytophthora nicotianae]
MSKRTEELDAERSGLRLQHLHDIVVAPTDSRDADLVEAMENTAVQRSSRHWKLRRCAVPDEQEVEEVVVARKQNEDLQGNLLDGTNSAQYGVRIDQEKRSGPFDQQRDCYSKTIHDRL